jgi:hypothetical protein
LSTQLAGDEGEYLAFGKAASFSQSGIENKRNNFSEKMSGKVPNTESEKAGKFLT